MIGVSYILAFNVPPIEITGTALILVVCNVFRNMPVGVRAGMASISQIDRSLDEASSTLGARGATTLRRILLPLLKPAVVAALVYSFVRAMTTVSAVIFLVSAEYEWATTYIINRVVNGDYGVAIAYSSVLIVLMVAVIGSSSASSASGGWVAARAAPRCLAPVLRNWVARRHEDQDPQRGAQTQSHCRFCLAPPRPLVRRLHESRLDRIPRRHQDVR